MFAYFSRRLRLKVYFTGLLHRAELVSGNFIHRSPHPRTEERKLPLSLAAADRTSCPAYELCRTSAILAKQANINVDTSAGQPAWGGGAFPLPMRETMTTAQFNKVPVMQGGTSNEGLFQLGLSVMMELVDQ